MRFYCFHLMPWAYLPEDFPQRYDQIGWGIGVYVAETDEQARREYEPHFWYYARNLLRTPARFSLPPGHTSVPTTIGMAERRRQSRPSTLATWDEVERGGYVAVGSPDTVRQRLEVFVQTVLAYLQRIGASA